MRLDLQSCTEVVIVDRIVGKTHVFRCRSNWRLYSPSSAHLVDQPSLANYHQTQASTSIQSGQACAVSLPASCPYGCNVVVELLSHSFGARSGRSADINDQRCQNLRAIALQAQAEFLGPDGCR